MEFYKFETKEEFTKRVMSEIWKSPTSVGQKIQAYIKIRRDNHGNDKIQDLCSKYLDMLYETKFEMLQRGEKLW